MYSQKRNNNWKVSFVIILLLMNLLLMVGCDKKMLGISIHNKNITKEGIIEQGMNEYEEVNKIDVEVEIGDIKISYGTDDFTIKAEYHLQSKSNEDMTEIIDQIEIYSAVEEDTLMIYIVKKEDQSNIWRWIKDQYKDMDFYINLDILIPKKMEIFHLYSHLGDIILKDVNGEINAKTGLGDILMEEVECYNNCVIQSDMGNIDYKLASHINQSSNVNLYTSMGDIEIDASQQEYKIIASEEEMMGRKETIIIDGLSTITAETSMGNLTLK